MSYFNSKPIPLQSASCILLSLCLMSGVISQGAIAQMPHAASTNARGESVFALGSRDYYGSEIYLIRPHASQLLQLTHNSGFDSHPVWSPDGTKIAFQRTPVMGQSDIWVMNTDGSNPVNLTNTFNQTESEQSPAWSPDGTRIAFISTRGSSNWQVWVMNADGSNARRLVNNNAINSNHPNWSPDGRTIQFWGSACSPSNNCSDVANLYRMNADGSELVEIDAAHFKQASN